MEVTECTTTEIQYPNDKYDIVNQNNEILYQEENKTLIVQQTNVVRSISSLSMNSEPFSQCKAMELSSNSNYVEQNCETNNLSEKIPRKHRRGS